MKENVRVRYAPSPTGHLHIGNARTALFNYLFARSQNGSFIIRVEDTDQKRNVAQGEYNQLNYLKWLGIDWDESIDKDGGYGPYRQIERLSIYDCYVGQLLDQDQAYLCYCTEEELEKDRQAQLAEGLAPKYSGRCRHLTAEQRAAYEAEGRQPSVRFKVPQGRTYAFNDIVKDAVSFESDGIGDFVIKKKDGIPTYNFAVAVDDYLMAISHVLRGDDHISNTPKQLMIYEAFGWQAPVFGHMTLIVNEQHKKLSKRDENIIQFIEQYEALGYVPEALFNFITLLGWSPQGEQELFTREQLIERFDPERLSNSPAVFDMEKLKWMNNQYIKEASLDRVVDLALPHLLQAGRLHENRSDQEQQWARELIALYQSQLSYGAQIVELTELFFKTKPVYSQEARAVLAEGQVADVLQALSAQLEALDDYEPEAISQALKSVQKQTGYKGKKLFMPVRVAATGQMHGPELPKTLYLLGRHVVVERLQDVIKQKF